MYCTNCGKKLANDDIFCKECGKKVNNNMFNQNSNKVNDNLALILGIISIILYWLPFISIPLAVISINSGKKYQKVTNKKSSSIIISIISIILSIINITIIVFTIILLIFNIENEIEPKTYEYYEYNEQDVDNNYFDITGYKWQGTDFSMLYLNTDQTYNWYIDDNDHNNNFHSGTYEVYNGNEAIEYIATKLPEFGITKEEQLKLFETGKYKIEDYYLILLKCNYSNINGQVNTEENGEVPYYGFYYSNKKYLSLINMKSINQVNFSLKSKIEKNDNIL